jgi:toxin FitB
LILLDTNVISELFRSQPSSAVENWLRENEPLLLLNSVTLSELAYGIALLSQGTHRRTLTMQYDLTVQQFNGRIVPFAGSEAQIYAEIRAAARFAGRPMSVADAQIASIARSLNVPLATRNTNDFQSAGLTLINPWSYVAP